MKTVAFIPIKMESQRLPHKNILPLGEKPLCWYVPNTLKHVKNIDEVYVYCSNLSIKDYLPEGVQVLRRDSALDGNLVKGAEIYRSFVREIDADIYVLAHTTSPFLRTETVFQALKKVQDGSHDSAFSAQKVQTFSWYRGNPINYNLTDVPRTQDIEPIYVETSGFYIFRKNIFTQMGRRIGLTPYIQEVDGVEAIDIDTRENYDFACKLALQRS